MALGEDIWRREVTLSDNYNLLKTYHDQAYRKIEERLQFDEEGQKSKALASYDEGLQLIDKALSVNIECPANPDFTWEKACSMVDKLRKTRKEILSRVADTQVERPAVLEPRPERPEELSLEPPPSYEEAMATSPSSSSASNIPSIPHSSASPSHNPITYSELGEALQNLKVETNMQSVQIIFIVDNVRIYFISPSGSVSAPSEPAQLRVLQLEDGRDSELPQFFLQVGDWFYPLVPDVSPCFRSEFGAFILPDLQSNVEGAAVGLVLPPESDTSLFIFLSDVLHGVVSGPATAASSDLPQSRTRREAFSTVLSKGIVTGAHYLSTGLIKGAEKASVYMTNTTPKIISRIQPEETPRPVPNSVRTGAKVARNVTNTAVNVTGYVDTEVTEKVDSKLDRHLAKITKNFNKKLAISRAKAERKERRHSREYYKSRESMSETEEAAAEEMSSHSLRRPNVKYGKRSGRATFAVKKPGKVGSATLALGRYLAPHVQRGGTKLLTKAGITDQTAAEGVGGVLTVAAGAVEGFGTIYTGLEQAAGVLGTSLTNNTVQIVQHKYGEPMATVTGDTLFTVGNVINTSNNISYLTPKGLAKKTAKNTGKALVEPHLVDLKDLNLPSTSQKK